jgi:hypothetical protein
MMAEAAFSTPFGFVWTFFASRAIFYRRMKDLNKSANGFIFNFCFFIRRNFSYFEKTFRHEVNIGEGIAKKCEECFRRLYQILCCGTHCKTN